MKVIKILVSFILLPIISYAQNADINKANASILLIIKNSPIQKLKIRLITDDGNYKHLDSVVLGKKNVDTLHYDIVVKKEFGEQQLNLFFTVKGPGFIIPTLEPGDHLEITTDLLLPGIINHTSFKGSARTKELFDFLKNGNELSKIYLAQKDKYLNAVIAGKADSVRQKSLLDSLEEVRTEFEKQQALKTLSPAVFNFALVSTKIYGFNFTDSQYKYFREKFKYDPYTLKQIDIAQATNKLTSGETPMSDAALKTIFINFTFPDAKGQMVSLSDFKGKYVLVDMWASWCVPCRQESPYLKEAVKRFGKNNFVILSVSIDINHNNWQKAIAQDSTQAFIHLIDDKGWKAQLIKAYKIQGIPANFLLNPQGQIINKDLRGKELIAKLSGMFNRD